MTHTPSDDHEAILAALIDRFLVDRERGALAPLEFYQALLPGHEALVAEEYAKLPAEAEERPAAAPSESEELDFALGQYRVIEEIGRGGQGIVYLAEDSALQRKVALKVLNLGAALSRDALQRFEREAAIASRLDHPSICPVYEVGSEKGLSWIAMRHVAGETLAQRIAKAREEGRTRTPAEIEEAIALLERIARALHAAHEAGVVHRDVKPGNVMVMPGGEPVILDFGLARDAQSGAASLTRTGEQYGTPAYMAPEQLRGERREIDRRADVWALGVTLFECLTLQRPFEGPTRESTERSILNEEPSRARRLNTHVPRDVAVVIEKALEKDPARRYPSAEAFAEELRRVRQREPIVARPAGVGLRLGRWVRRNPLAAAFLAVLTIGLSVAIALLIEIDRRGRETGEALARTRALAIARAAREAIEEDPRLALHLALAGVDSADPPLAECLSEVHRALAAVHERKTFATGGPVEMLQLSRDGTRLLTPSHDGTGQIWDLEGRLEEPLVVFGGIEHGHRGAVHAAVFSPDEARVVTASSDGTARLWTSDGTFLRALAHPAPVRTAAFHPRDGRILVTGCEDGCARIWTLEGEEPRILELPHGGGPVRASFSPDGELVLTYVRDTAFERDISESTARLWNLAGEELARLEHDEMIISAVFSPDEERVLTTSLDRRAKLWKRDGSLIETLREHRDGVLSAAFSPDGRFLATTSKDFTARLWNAHTGEELDELRGHTGIVMAVAFSRPGPEFPVTLVATSSEDRTIRVWTLAGQPVATLRGHREGRILWAVEFVPGSFPPRLVSAADDGTARVWELWFPELPVLIGHEGSVYSAAIAPIGEPRIATTSADGMVRTWSPRGHPLKEMPIYPNNSVSVTFSPDGALLAASGEGGVKIWDAASGSLLRETPYPREIIFPVSFVPPDGKQLLIPRPRRSMQLMDLEGGRTVDHPHAPDLRSILYAPSGGWFLTAHEDEGLCRMSCDGDLLASLPGVTGIPTAIHPGEGRFLTARSREMTLWSLEGRPLGPPILTTGVSSATFSPDGERILSAHRDGTVRLWSLTGELLAALPCHQAPQRGARFTPDGKRILTWSNDSTARLWFADTADLLDFAREKNTRVLTPEERQRHGDLLDR